MSTPVIQIDLGSAIPAYRQIADAIRALIVEQQLAAGYRLPTVRELAGNLAVHHNTVAEAYRQLSSEGWVDLGRGRGAIVRERNAPLATDEARNQFTQRLRELIAKAKSDGLAVEEIERVFTSITSAGKES